MADRRMDIHKSIRNVINSGDPSLLPAGLYEQVYRNITPLGIIEKGVIHGGYT